MGLWNGTMWSSFSPLCPSLNPSPHLYPLLGSPTDRPFFFPHSRLSFGGDWQLWGEFLTIQRELLKLLGLTVFLRGNAAVTFCIERSGFSSLFVTIYTTLAKQVTWLQWALVDKQYLSYKHITFLEGGCDVTSSYLLLSPNPFSGEMLLLLCSPRCSPQSKTPLGTTPSQDEA